jgi:hypothetical protein
VRTPIHSFRFTPSPWQKGCLQSQCVRSPDRSRLLHGTDLKPLRLSNQQATKRARVEFGMFTPLNSDVAKDPKASNERASRGAVPDLFANSTSPEVGSGSAST